jgi:death-on-curing family protein
VAVLLYELCKSQAFVDGNKRVAVIVLRAFLHINGCRLAAEDRELARVILRTAASNQKERAQVIIDLAHWLEAAVVPYAEEET